MIILSCAALRDAHLSPLGLSGSIPLLVREKDNPVGLAKASPPNEGLSFPVAADMAHHPKYQIKIMLKCFDKQLKLSY